MRAERLLPALVAGGAADRVVEPAAAGEVVAVDEELPGARVGAEGVDVGLGVDLVGGGDFFFSGFFFYPFRFFSCENSALCLVLPLSVSLSLSFSLSLYLFLSFSFSPSPPEFPKPSLSPLPLSLMLLLPLPPLSFRTSLLTAADGAAAGSSE